MVTKLKVIVVNEYKNTQIHRTRAHGQKHIKARVFYTRVYPCMYLLLFIVYLFKIHIHFKY